MAREYLEAVDEIVSRVLVSAVQNSYLGVAGMLQGGPRLAERFSHNLLEHTAIRCAYG